MFDHQLVKHQYSEYTMLINQFIDAGINRFVCAAIKLFSVDFAI
jgi:hypothetical protein